MSLFLFALTALVGLRLALCRLGVATVILRCMLTIAILVAMPVIAAMTFALALSLTFTLSVVTSIAVAFRFVAIARTFVFAMPSTLAFAAWFRPLFFRRFGVLYAAEEETPQAYENTDLFCGRFARFLDNARRSGHNRCHCGDQRRRRLGFFVAIADVIHRNRRLGGDEVA